MIDGIFTARIERAKITCNICQQKTTGFYIKVPTQVKLPEGVKPARNLIICDANNNFHTAIGIGCGCYARFHRQLAHIEHNMRRKHA